ncbi:MAG: nucleotide exchange factor GrpE [Nanoarchaeota archaeon]|nr:nucleotide exchange factor GrpE [Nanoarchaeota archaeon]MBU1269113.1 nucleotide exchange factor GrpE [Nanoarchaeota archaeon]MBU1604910.1 nucleotide exchange factor GrpE [Nanoarchaeota archaeon]MBU2443119.1 nucleotide exchange factor GrpE [Nanoarchaeota archaeon]
MNKKEKTKKTVEKHPEEKTIEPTEKIQKLEEEKKELINTLQRLQAEFENYKKRTENECADVRKYAEEELIKSLLSILDNFELALKNKECKEEFTKGVELIYSQLFQMLEDCGLKPIKCEGEKFNPYMHEALLSEKTDQEENTVLEELQKGYKLHDKVIRHAKVKVSKKK